MDEEGRDEKKEPAAQPPLLEREAGKLKQGLGSWKSRSRAHGLSTNQYGIPMVGLLLGHLREGRLMMIITNVSCSAVARVYYAY